MKQLMKKIICKVLAVVLVIGSISPIYPAIEVKAEETSFSYYFDESGLIAGSSDSTENDFNLKIGDEEKVSIWLYGKATGTFDGKLKTFALESTSATISTKVNGELSGDYYVYCFEVDIHTTASGSGSAAFTVGPETSSVFTPITITIKWDIEKLEDEIEVHNVSNIVYGQPADDMFGTSQSGLEVNLKVYQGDYDATGVLALLQPGSYVAEFTTPGNATYKPAKKEVPFTVAKAPTTLTMKQSGSSVTTTLTCYSYPGEVLETIPTFMYVMYYKKAGASDSTYSTTFPKEPGDYVAKASITNDGYNQVYADGTTTFTIDRLAGGGTVTVADVTYGTPIKPVLSSEKNGTDKVTLTYKLSAEPDSAYTSTIPTKPGEYVVKAVFAETNQYEAYTTTDTFVINKAPGEGTVTAKDCYLGFAPELAVSSTKNTSKNYTVEYKKSGAADSTYKTAIPLELGDYVVRVTFSEDEYFLKAYATDTFRVLSLPAPSYTIAGIMGSNGYYTSSVTITPETGYEISAAGTTNFASAVILNESVSNLLLNFRVSSTGFVTESSILPDLLIDKDEPKTADIVDGTTYFEETKNVTIKDENLSKVTVNGINVKVENGQAVLALESNYQEEEYHIVATDLAGNTAKYHVTIKSPWLESGIVLTGIPLFLEAGIAYQLGDGEWTVSGDDTVYAGGMTFYVPADETLTFTKND